MWNTVLFDLDGTLTDSGEGITKCVQYALEKMGRPVPERKELEVFVGPPLLESFMKYGDMSGDEAANAIDFYRERYSSTGMYENRLYPWILKLLELFWRKGITMGVASSKPEVYVVGILQYFGIDNYFKVIVGSELDGTRVAKKEVIEEALQRLGMEARKHEVVMVGDRKHDIIGAESAGIASIGVTYGYGSREEVEKETCVFVADNVSDIAECVLRQHSRLSRETVPHKIWSILYPLGIIYGVQLITVSVWSTLFTVLEMILYGNMDTNDIMGKLLFQNNWMIAISSLVCIPLLLWLYRKDEWRRKELGLRNRIMQKERFGIPSMVVVGVFAIILSNFFSQMIEWSGLNQMFPTYSEQGTYLFREDNMFGMFLGVGILGPMAEELAFRGLFFRRIRDYLNVSWGILISAAVFGIYHGNVVQFVFALLMGLVFAALYERYQTLWAPILAHVAVNVFACICNVQGVDLMAGGGTTFVVYVAIEILAAAVLGAVIFRKRIVRK